MELYRDRHGHMRMSEVSNRQLRNMNLNELDNEQTRIARDLEQTRRSQRCSYTYNRPHYERELRILKSASTRVAAEINRRLVKVQNVQTRVAANIGSGAVANA
jgi:hypothetical protein